MSTPRTEMCMCCGHENPPAKRPAVLTMCPACFYVGPPSIDVAEHRAVWIKDAGMVWMSARRTQPKQWNPLNNLARLALATTRARTKGRPPRMN